VLAGLSPARRAKIDERVAELIAQEVGLSDLRREKRLTQVQMAKRIGGKQVYVSRFEKRSDVKLSKLYKYVDALGLHQPLQIAGVGGHDVQLGVGAGGRYFIRIRRVADFRSVRRDGQARLGTRPNRCVRGGRDHEVRQPTEPRSVSQMIRALNTARKNNRLYVRLLASDSGAVISGEPLSSLPPSVLGVLESDRSAGEFVPLRSATLREWDLPMEYVVTGSRTLSLTLDAN
jgi:transcriptional regulator with XRE-family HTH domain